MYSHSSHSIHDHRGSFLIAFGSIVFDILAHSPHFFCLRMIFCTNSESFRFVFCHLLRNPLGTCPNISFSFSSATIACMICLVVLAGEVFHDLCQDFNGLVHGIPLLLICALKFTSARQNLSPSGTGSMIPLSGISMRVTGTIVVVRICLPIMAAATNPAR